MRRDPAFCLPPPAVLLLAWLFCSTPAQAQIMRCVDANGEVVYTDRKCEDIGATERLIPAVVPAPRRRVACSRRLRDLVGALRNAVDNNDANHLASLYDWSGMSTRNGYVLMDQLERIVRRPLLDILPVYPTPPTAVLAADGSVADPNLDGFYPQVERRTPTRLRLIQTFPNGHTPSQTVFGLHKKLGCWWIRM